MEGWYDHGGDPVSEARWEKWSSYGDLPFPGDNLPFDTFLDSRGLRRESLVRIGTRWATYPDGSGRGSLAYLFPDGIKYRTLDGDRTAESGVTWNSAKKISATPGQAGTSCAIAEGETDAAVLAQLVEDARRRDATAERSHDSHAPDEPVLESGEDAGGTSEAGELRGVSHSTDIFILPAGAKHVPPNLERQLSGYSRIYVALDSDEAGSEGAGRLLDIFPQAVRVLPPSGKDWCEAAAAGDLTDWTPEAWVVRPPRTIFSVREVLRADLGTYAENNWFAGDILPVGGETIIHGPIKSLKSVVAMEMARGIVTGTQFAGYLDFCRPAGPGRVLLIQFEIPPRGFQQRLQGMLDAMPASDRDRFQDNFMIYGVADRTRPRLKMQDQGFVSQIRRAVEEAEAEVIMFDPMQRMTGGANTDKSYEMEPILDMFSQLQGSGLTVIYTHHDVKSGGNNVAAYNMSGSQRFGADADSVCSLIYDPKTMIPDDNSAGIKQRNFVWTLRSGATQGRSITASPNVRDPEHMDVTYDVPVSTVTLPSAPVTPTSVVTTTAPALGMPSIK